MDRGALRDKARNTRLLILAHLHARPGATLSEVANHLDVTVQAVSVHAKALAAEQYLTVSDGTYRVASPGLQWLHEGVRSLHAAVNNLGEQLAVIHTTSAVAIEDISRNTPVVLFMQDGDLAARPGTQGGSRGIAQSNATAGDEVVVGKLTGMVDLQPGAITIITVPEPTRGGIKGVDEMALAARIEELGPFDLVSALGTGAAILARRLGAVDLQFAAAEASFNAAERGLQVLLIASQDRLVEALQVVERSNLRTLRRIPVHTWEAPTQ